MVTPMSEHPSPEQAVPGEKELLTLIAAVRNWAVWRRERARAGVPWNTPESILRVAIEEHDEELAERAKRREQPSTEQPSPEQARYHLAWLMWCYSEGYVNAVDRALMDNWFGEHQDNDEDESTRQSLLAMADEVLRLM